MSLAEAIAVPPMRLAGLLATRRNAAGLGLHDIADRSVFSVAELAAIERGERVVEPVELVALLRAYQADADSSVIPTRDSLLLDLDRQELEIGDHRVRFESPVVDDVLDGYIGLLRDVRALPETAPLVLRDDDLEKLSLWLGPDADTLRVRIDVLAQPTVEPWYRSTIAVAAITALVVSAAALLAFLGVEAVRSPDQSVQTVVEPGVEVSALAGGVAAEAVAVNEAPAPILERSTDASNAVATVEALVELSPRARAIEQAVGWDFRAALPGWEVLHAGAHPRWRGITNSVERSVTLFDRESASVADAAAVLAHELGHAIDLEYLNDELRFEWLELRGIDAPWWAEEGLADFSVGAGDFAEAVAAHLVGAPSRSDFGAFDDDQLAFVTRVFDSFEA